MSDHLLLLGWNRASRGREQEALEVFGESLHYYQSLVDDGVIESFEPVLLYPHGGDLNGFLLIRGTSESLNALLDNVTFQRLLVKAQWSVDGIGVIKGTTGEALVGQMAMFAEQAAADA